MFDASFAENHGDELHAAFAEERSAGCIGQMFDIDRRDVTNDVLGIVNHRHARQAFGVHQNQGFGQRSVGTGGQR